MPKSEELATEFKSLQELAMQIDENPERAEELAVAKPAPESRPEPVQDDKVEEEAPKEETPEVEAADTAEIEPEDLEPKAGDNEYIRKEKERIARNWQKFQSDRVSDKEAKEKIAAADERARIAEEKAAKLASKPTELIKDGRGFTAEDYERAVEIQEREGNWEQAKMAREEALRLRYEGFRAEWLANRAPLLDANPDLRNMDSPLAKEVERLIAEPDNPFVTRTTGLKYAVMLAQANVNAGSISAVKAENEKLKNELDRLAKLGAIPGRDGAMKRVSSKAFADMSLDEQRAQLYRQAEELDAEAMRY